ncbi:MAG: hypothetical protein FWD17_10195 [Polyangiaceae bacterium]|nr:hypothetical protein [Polyangiaceae bacterium]
MHVARPPFTHAVCPSEHVSEHVDEHAALGAAPAQLSGAAHAVVDATYRQPWASALHVATFCASWHTVPLPAQRLAAHVQDAPATPTAHVS